MRIAYAITGVAALFVLSLSVRAENPTPYAGMRIIDTDTPIAEYQEKLLGAIQANKMGIVARACADCGAKAVLDKEIPKNRVIMIFHPRFAVRMLEASVAAGIEAPLRLYLTEQDDGTAKLTYRLPSHIFGAYEVDALDKLGEDLDGVVARIVAEAGK
ncbi:MAG: hypothetical protein MAG794_00305 [Gammaproteobacteria bacterium]|nr:hypothetical protein [Gammaproteobacteria bacterium]